ncbi:hypothetical protein HPP92_004913 [Vanilla planifolia]|uniref:tRNA(Ile)-lysidine synthetase n=1 Tax=Vanilla planifolia TaxID=51239 RepID=A0A835RR81_VANPL|nr:hypothetical protein HPP92_004913 [Vanilla planifolia]
MNEKLGKEKAELHNLHGYHIFQEFCLKEKINILLVAHHADDQAELFILRLSRNSGVLGLAGMPFVSQLFLQHSSHWWSASGNHLILLVRPMLEFSKDDIYKICHGGQLTWVEDPTNRNSLFARNRIRISLGNLPSSSFSSEIQKFISACRLTRTVIENSCRKMLKRCVSVMDEGYTIINLEKLDPLNINDLYLSKFLDVVLQFTSQRLRPIRGSAMRLLLGYVRSLPCKTSLTAAGCYLCAAPRSKGTKMIITCLPEASLPSKILSPPMHCQQSPLTCTTEQIISDAVSFSDQLLGEASCIPFLHARSSEAILREAVQLKLISEPTCASIQSLQMEERENFISKKEAERQYDSLCRTKVSSSSNLELYPGQSCHFMCRFLITWKLHDGEDAASVCKEHNKKSVQSWEHFCESCAIAQERRVKIRHMVDADWLYLAELSKSQAYGDDVNDAHTLFCQKGHNTTMERHCSCLMRSSAQEALHNLKSIPAAARRALPVLASSHDLPVSIPSIGFSSCPCLQIDAEFMPRVPLGGGYSSYL